MEQLLAYNLSSMTYHANQRIEVDSRCNGFTVVNIGNSDCIVNGIPLAPPAAPALQGEAAQFGGNRNEIYIGRIELTFTNNQGTAIVIQKIYENPALIKRDASR